MNISYGELSASGDVGRIRDLLAEAQRNGITIVSSAGNEGIITSLFIFLVILHFVPLLPSYQLIKLILNVVSLIRNRKIIVLIIAASVFPAPQVYWILLYLYSYVGPALGTVGAPGGVMSSCIGVGAILSSAMARDQHSLRYLFFSIFLIFDSVIWFRVCFSLFHY